MSELNKPRAGKFNVLAVKGKIILSKEPKFLSHIDIVKKAVLNHFKRLEMKDVHVKGDDYVFFKGGPGGFGYGRNDFALKENIEKGRIKVLQEGSELIANYNVDFLGRFIPKFCFPFFLVALLMVSQDDTRSLALPMIGGGLIVFLIITLIIIRLGMKKELLRAFQSAENMVEFQTGMYDTSHVEPEHRNFNPGNMLKSAYHYQQQGLREKARSYLSLLLEIYPWSDEASMALEELKKNR